jgi:hypothetical protein
MMALAAILKPCLAGSQARRGMRKKWTTIISLIARGDTRYSRLLDLYETNKYICLHPRN